VAPIPFGNIAARRPAKTGGLPEHSGSFALAGHPTILRRLEPLKANVTPATGPVYTKCQGTYRWRPTAKVIGNGVTSLHCPGPSSAVTMNGKRSVNRAQPATELITLYI